MKIDNELLDELVVTLIGEDVLPLIHILRDKRNVSEFKLAEKLNITVNQTRNMLYRLNEFNLVSFMRKKDKKKGWYIYYWTLNRKSAWNALRKLWQKQISDFKTRLQREEDGIFYVCPMGCMRMKMERAMEHDFKCQECGALLRMQDNKKTIANIKKRIESISIELEKQLELHEADLVRAKKRYAAKLKREEKAKLAKRAEKMAAKKKVKKKVAKKKVKKKKAVKKKAKKKAVKKKKTVKKKKVKKKVAKKKTTKKKVTKKKAVKKKTTKKAKKKKTAKKKVKKKKVTKKKATKKKSKK